MSKRGGFSVFALKIVISKVETERKMPVIDSGWGGGCEMCPGGGMSAVTLYAETVYLTVIQ